MWHDAERRKEGAEINQSLHALKECLRQWMAAQRSGGDARQGHIPFRMSPLTRVLCTSMPVRGPKRISYKRSGAYVCRQ